MSTPPLIITFPHYPYTKLHPSTPCPVFYLTRRKKKPPATIPSSFTLIDVVNQNSFSPKTPDTVVFKGYDANKNVKSHNFCTWFRFAQGEKDMLVNTTTTTANATTATVNTTVKASPTSAALGGVNGAKGWAGFVGLMGLVGLMV
jgi:hypothetical protein